MSFLPVHLRACIFVIAACCCAALFIRFIGYRRKDFHIWLAIWIAITGVAFVSQNIWILISFVAGVCLIAFPKAKQQRLSYYFALLPILPLFVYEIPGLIPGIRYLFDLTYARMLSIFVLLPMFIYMVRIPATVRRKFLQSSIDKLVFVYFILLCALALRNPTITAGVREMFVLFIDILVPYFVVRHYVNTFDDFEKVFTAIFFSATIVVFIALFEEFFRWWFYLYLPDLLGFRPLSFASRVAEMRGGFVRVKATMGPIPLSYFIALSLSVFLFIRKSHRLTAFAQIGIVFLFGLAIVFTSSRGGWLALLCMVGSYYVVNLPRDKKQMVTLVAFPIVLVMLLVTSVSLTSFDKHGTFQYRINLIQNSIKVIQKNPILGKENFKENKELEALRQGEGIIDVVNTYLQVALHSGLVGLVMFCSIFITTLIHLKSSIKRSVNLGDVKLKSLGMTLIAIIFGTIVMIGTVSSVSYIPIYYWLLFALCAAYTTMVSAASPSEPGISTQNLSLSKAN